MGSNAVKIKSSEAKKPKLEDDNLWNDAVGAVGMICSSTHSDSSDDEKLVIDIMSSPDKGQS